MGHTYHTPNPQGSGSSQKRGWRDSMSQRWLVTSRKQCLPDTTGQLHRWTHSDCDSMHKTSCSQTRSQHGVCGGEVGMKSHHCPRRGRAHFLWCDNHTAGQGPLPRLTGQHKLDSMEKETRKKSQYKVGKGGTVERMVMGWVGGGRAYSKYILNIPKELIVYFYKKKKAKPFLVNCKQCISINLSLTLNHLLEN